MPFLWLDNTDAFSAHAKLAKARRDLASWEWVRFNEEDHDSGMTYNAFSSEVMTYSLFNQTGKVVYTYGIPKFQAKFAKVFDEIPSKVLVILIAPPQRDTALWKRASAAEKGVKLELTVDLTRSNAVQWITARAKQLGAEIDEKSCKMLVDIVGLDHNKLHGELDKLRHLGDGRIAPWVVQQGACGTGESDVKIMCDAIIKGNPIHAHEMLNRVWSADSARTSEKVVKIFGYPLDWARRMAIAASCRSYDDDAKAKISQAAKGKDDEGNLIPMYPKPGAIYYAWKEYQESGRNKSWSIKMLMELGELQLALRQLDEEKRESLALTLLHQLVARAAGS